MKLVSSICVAIAALTVESSAFSAAQPPADNVTVNLQDEAYLGSITYSGGLLERGRLQLQNIEDIRYIRFDVPSHCRAEIFEAGTTTEGIDDLAEPTGLQDVYAVNQGRGNHVHSVFISLNGPQNQECAVLVFRRNTLNSNPGGAPNQATTCIENSLPFPVAAQIQAFGRLQNITIPPQRMMILQHALRVGEPLPALNIAFDKDLSPNLFWASYSIAVGTSRLNDCTNSPIYRFFSPNFNLIDLMRIR